MALQFVDPEKPQVYNGIPINYGILPILNALAQMSRATKRKVWTLYLINVETLIRDHKDNTVSQDILVRNILTDCTVMSQYISAYNRTVNLSNRQKPLICFYMSKYEHIPQAYQRDKFPKGTEERWKVRDAFTDLLSKEGFQNSFDDTEVVFATAGEEKGEWPHKVLVRDLQKKYDGIQFRPTLLVSHVPLDFHMYRTFSDFTLLESYTGNFKNQKDFGKKVFQDPNLPFNKYLHVLLGDKWYLKQQVEPKVKKMLISVATEQNWVLLPDHKVLEALNKMHITNLDFLIRPDI